MKQKHREMLFNLVSNKYFYTYTMKDHKIDHLLVLNKYGEYYILKCIDEYSSSENEYDVYFIGFLKSTSYNKIPKYDSIERHFYGCYKKGMELCFVEISVNGHTCLNIVKFEEEEFDSFDPYIMEIIFDGC